MEKWTRVKPKSLNLVNGIQLTRVKISVRNFLRWKSELNLTWQMYFSLEFGQKITLHCWQNNRKSIFQFRKWISSGFILTNDLLMFIFFKFFITVLKTGASGMIAYRLQTKEQKWQWLQTSSRLVYKNSKPDFIISTHRPLM